jgi:hypothetical protein
MNPIALLLPIAQLSTSSGLDFAANAAVGLVQNAKASWKKVQKYRYSDKISDRHIRLIRLLDHAAGGTDKLSDVAIALETHELGPRCPGLIALSYTWNPPRQSMIGVREKYSKLERRYVSVGACRLDVWPNLYDALKQLGSLYPPGTYFWADAICINQEDNKEKVQQMRIMDMIYGRADKTIAWLGCKTSRTADAIAVLHRDPTRVHTAFVSVLDNHIKGHYQRPILASDPRDLWSLGVIPLTEQDWTSLSDVFTRRWFARAWMVQEVALSKHLEVLCGDISIEWDTLAEFACLVCLTHIATSFVLCYPSNLQYLFMASGFAVATSLHLVRQWCGGVERIPVYEHVAQALDFAAGLADSGPGSTLLQLLLGTYGSVATCRRDKLYACHGILNSLTGLNYQTHASYAPDYATSTSDGAAFSKVCRAILSETGSLHLITLGGECGYMRFWPRIDGLPSWIPDFQPYRLSLPLLGPNFRRTRNYNCSGWAASSEGPSFVFDSQDSNRLWVQGTKIGIISGMGNKWEEMATQKRFEATFNLLDRIAPVYPLTEQPRMEVFWRTLLTDSDMANAPAHGNLGLLFSTWLRLMVFQALLAKLDSPFIRSREQPLDISKVLAASEVMERIAINDPTRSMPSRVELHQNLAEIGHQAISPIPSMVQVTPKKEYLAAWKRNSDMFVCFALLFANYKRVFSTDTGLVGSAHQDIRPGQTVWILSSCPAPVILRPAGHGAYHLVGEAYVHGAMYGELMTPETTWEKIALD